MKLKTNPSQSARISSGFTSTILVRMRFIAVAAALWAARTRRTATRLQFLLPRGKHFCFALGRKTGTQLGLALLRQRLEPGERVACRFGERLERQPFVECTVNFRASESALFSGPDRHVRPRLDFVLRKEIFSYPCERRTRLQSSFDPIKHSVDA